MKDCWYVTQGWGEHDARWVQALEMGSVCAHVISIERDGTDIATLPGELAAHPNWPVLAGPITTVTQALTGIPNRLVALSWGFDLITAAQGGNNLAWLGSIDGVIVDSNFTRNIAKSFGVHSASITQIPWGVDLEVFQPDGPKVSWAELGIHREGPIVLSLRALEPLYRVGDLVEAWPAVTRSHPDATLVIGNTGSLAALLQERTEALDVSESVTFIGRRPEADLPSMMRSASRYVSTSPIDGTSVTLLQAMACGLPVLVTNSPGNMEWVIDGGTGRTFATSDVADLSQRLSAGLSDPQACSGLARSAREEVTQRADWFRNIRQLPAVLFGC